MTILSKKPELDPVDADPPFKIIERDGKRYIDKDEVGDILEYSDVIDEHGGKHDCTTSVRLINLDGKLYRFTVELSYEHGLQCDYDVELERVEVVPAQGWKIVPRKAEK